MREFTFDSLRVFTLQKDLHPVEMMVYPACYEGLKQCLVFFEEATG